MAEKEFPTYVDAESAAADHAHDDVRSKRRGTADSQPSSNKTIAEETIPPRSDEKGEESSATTANKQPPVMVPLGGVTRTKATAVTATPALTRTMSRIRSRDPGQIQTFSHPLEHVKTGHDSIVEFDGPDDPYRPTNWPARKKWTAVALYGLTTSGVTFDSSVFSTAIVPISEEFGVGREVATLGLAFMLFGFGLGPLLWGPLSEVYGRKLAVLVPCFISMIFTFSTGASKDIQTVLLTRFFSGLFGSAPICNTGGCLGDMFPPRTRGKALVFYAMAVVGGPTMGPLVGGAIVQSSLGWRWTEYITGIFKAVVLFLDVLLLDESYPPVLLLYKARALRIKTGNWALHARHEEWDVSVRELASKYLLRPMQLLGTPICFLVALYASFVYGLLYALLEAIPIEFQDIRGWGPVTGALPFVAVLVGIFIAAVINILNQRYYLSRIDANGGKAVPEARLPPMCIGSVVFSAGLWLFAWTSGKDVHWMAPMVACSLFGLGFFAIFQAALNYLIDTFQRWGASAIAANTFLRSVFAGTFPLFVRPMLEAMGVNWGVTVFAFVSVALIPVPYVFFFFGKRIRARGVWSRDSV